jgi:hypothetical protein
MLRHVRHHGLTTPTCQGFESRRLLEPTNDVGYDPPSMPKAAAKPSLDWSLVPGTKREQIAAAHRVSKPIKIEKSGSKWLITVLGMPIGFVSTKESAKSAAHTIGRYKLDLGDFVFAYTEGY